jgi:hypothetical protein
MRTEAHLSAIGARHRFRRSGESPVDKLINTQATVALLEMMATIGLGVTFAGVLGVAGREPGTPGSRL